MVMFGVQGKRLSFLLIKLEKSGHEIEGWQQGNLQHKQTFQKITLGIWDAFTCLGIFGAVTAYAVVKLGLLLMYYQDIMVLFKLVVKFSCIQIETGFYAFRLKQISFKLSGAFSYTLYCTTDTFL